MRPQIQRITGIRLYFIPVQTRVPLKFGPETLTSVTCARAAVKVVDAAGREVEGWGETPLSVQWVWPGNLSYEYRHDCLREFCRRLASAWMNWAQPGHPLEIGFQFQEHVLPKLLGEPNAGSPGRRDLSDGRGAVHRVPLSGADPGRGGTRPYRDAMPWLAALVCSSPFDLALHDAFGKLIHRPVYETYGADLLNRDLAHFLEPAADATVSFAGRYPAEFLVAQPPKQLRAWHLVGGLDPIGPEDLKGDEPKDGHPVLLGDWIQRDGLKCLKVKLRGNDSAWDYSRLLRVGQVAAQHGVECLSADFNCTVKEPTYVNEVLDRLKREHSPLFDKLLYVEQPFPYELEQHRINVRSVSSRKPLFLDESAHDWRMVRLGRELGWTGVALKTCKTQTGAILSACWAKAHGMSLMVQDLTNPMLAQIPHVLLAAQVGTIMGVETNSMQFYPAASDPEEKVHPGLYQRRGGNVDWSSVSGPGFGYRLNEISRKLPDSSVVLG